MINLDNLDNMISIDSSLDGYYGIYLCFQKVWWMSNVLIFSNIFVFRKAKQTFYVTHLIREDPSVIIQIFCDRTWKGYLSILQHRKGLCQQVIFSIKFLIKCEKDI